MQRRGGATRAARVAISKRGKTRLEQSLIPERRKARKAIIPLHGLGVLAQTILRARHSEDGEMLSPGKALLIRGGEVQHFLKCFDGAVGPSPARQSRIDFDDSQQIPA